MQLTDLKQPRAAYSAYRELLEAYYENGWTDGLPVAPPTVEKVRAFLEAGGVGPAEVVGEVPSREVTVTAEQVAINAVMAGCRPEYMPVVLAAARAHLSPKANCHSTTATLSGAAHAVIVNGPARGELGILCREGCFGPGARANATIGRALRLMIRNVCRSVPGFADRATFAQPARYSFCFGEDEEGSAWQPLHAERGFAREASVVTILAFTDYFAHHEQPSGTPEAFLDRLASTARSRTIAEDTFVGDDRAMLFVIGPEHRDFLEAAGWTKARVRAYLYPRLTAPHTRGEGASDESGMQPTGGGAESSFWLPRPEGVQIIGAGGPGLALSWVFYPHLAAVVSVACGDDRVVTG